MDELPRPLSTLLTSARLKHFPKGQIILYGGDTPSDALILKNGVVKLHDIDEQGNEKVLHLVKPPAVMPLVLFQQNPEITPWFYTALIDCDIYVAPQREFFEQMHKDLELTTYLMQWFAYEAHELLVRLSSLGKTTARDKLVAALKFLSVRHAIVRRSGWRRVNFPVNHQLLADMIGVTRESTAVSMKELQDEHLVRYPRLTILEINFEALVKLSA